MNRGLFSLILLLVAVGAAVCEGGHHHSHHRRHHEGFSSALEGSDGDMLTVQSPRVARDVNGDARDARTAVGVRQEKEDEGLLAELRAYWPRDERAPHSSGWAKDEVQVYLSTDDAFRPDTVSSDNPLLKYTLRVKWGAAQGRPHEGFVVPGNRPLFVCHGGLALDASVLQPDACGSPPTKCLCLQVGARPEEFVIFVGPEQMHPQPPVMHQFEALNVKATNFLGCNPSPPELARPKLWDDVLHLLDRPNKYQDLLTGHLEPSRDQTAMFAAFNTFAHCLPLDLAPEALSDCAREAMFAVAYLKVADLWTPVARALSHTVSAFLAELESATALDIKPTPTTIMDGLLQHPSCHKLSAVFFTKNKRSPFVLQSKFVEWTQPDTEMDCLLAMAEVWRLLSYQRLAALARKPLAAACVNVDARAFLSL